MANRRCSGVSFAFLASSSRVIFGLVFSTNIFDNTEDDEDFFKVMAILYLIRRILR